jgi:hypothetical protein
MGDPIQTLDLPDFTNSLGFTNMSYFSKLYCIYPIKVASGAVIASFDHNTTLLSVGNGNLSEGDLIGVTTCRLYARFLTFNIPHYVLSNNFSITVSHPCE